MKKKILTINKFNEKSEEHGYSIGVETIGKCNVIVCITYKGEDFKTLYRAYEEKLVKDVIKKLNLEDYYSEKGL